jgi:WD40 repeat protein
VANATIHSVIPLLNDALSLIGEYYDPIRANPLQVYQSALLFMPCCALYMAACKDLRDSRLLSPREPAWSSDALIFQPAPNEHSEAIRCISVSPDNTLVAAVSRYALRVVVWKTSTGQVLATWVPDASKLLYILTISFSLDGKQLAIMTPVAVHWWDPHTDLRRIQTIDLKPPSRYQGQILSHSAISAGGACLAVGFSGDIDEVSLQAVDINTGEARILLRDLTVTSVAVSPDASRIASSLDDGSVPVWNARDGELLSTLNGFGLSAVALTFTLRHNIIAMTEDGAVRMRGAKSDDLVFTLGEVPVETAGRTARNFYKASLISASALSPLVAIATSKAVSIWSEDTRQLVARRQLYSDPSDGYWNTLNTAVAFMSDRPGLIVAPTQEDVYLWNFQTQQAANAPPFDLLGRAINSVRFSHDGCFVISGSDDPDLRVWKTCSGVLEATIRTGHTRSVTAVAFALRDRSLVLSGADDSQDMELREAESCGLLQHFDTSSRMQMSDQLLAFSLDGSQFATMSQDSSWNVLRLYKSDTGHVLAEEPQSESEYFSAISFLPDGSRIIAMSLSAMKSWSTLTQPPLMDPRTTSISAQRQDYFRSFACSSDSALIVSASERGEIYLWDARTGEKIQTASDFALLDLETPVPEYSNFHALQYSPTTRGRFLSCSWAGVIRIWNDDKLEIERTIMPIHLGPGRHLTPGSDVTACYSPDGERIAVAAEHITIGGNLRRYQLGVYEVNTGHAIQELAPIISYIAHEDPGSCESLNDASQMSLGFSPDGQHVFFLKAGLPRVEVWSVLNGEHIGSLWSPLRTGLAAFSICPITARLIVTCNPKSITHRVTEAAEVSVELVAQSGLAGANATAMCISIAQDLFEANQTYLCVWDTYSFQLQSTLRCGHDGFQPPHSCIAQDSRSLLRQPLPRHHTVPAVRQIPRLHRPRFDLSSNGWVVFFLNPDGVSPRRYRAEDTEDEDLLIEVCNIPGNRRPAIFSALLKSYRSPWGPVAVHRYVLAIGSLRGSVSIIDLTSLITKVERRADLEQS